MTSRDDRTKNNESIEGNAPPETQIAAERFLTIQDVCNRLKVSRTTVWRLMNEHGLRVVRIGGIRRIRERDLVDWLERHSSGNDQTRE